MYSILLGLLVLVGLFLSVVILLQSGKGGGLAAMGGGAASTDVLGGRQATTLLTRATWTAGTVFMVLSLVLAIMSSRSAAPTSILEGVSSPAAAPQPILDGATPAPAESGEATPPSDGNDGEPQNP